MPRPQRSRRVHAGRGGARSWARGACCHREGAPGPPGRRAGTDRGTHGHRLSLKWRARRVGAWSSQECRDRTAWTGGSPHRRRRRRRRCRGGGGRGAAVDEGGVDHRQVEAGRKQGDVRMGTNGVQGGGHTVEGERQAGAELELCFLPATVDSDIRVEIAPRSPTCFEAT